MNIARAVRHALFTLPVAVFACVQGAPAHADTSIGRATIPFAFHYGPTTLPPGRYSLVLMSENIMVLRGQNTSAMALVNQGSDAQAGGVSRLVFHRYGSELALQDVVLPNRREHLSCLPNKHLKQHEVAMAGSASSDLVLALVGPSL